LDNVTKTTTILKVNIHQNVIASPVKA